MGHLCKFEFHSLFHPSKDHYILGDGLGEGQYGTVRAAVATVDQAQHSACFDMGWLPPEFGHRQRWPWRPQVNALFAWRSSAPQAARPMQWPTMMFGSGSRLMRQQLIARPLWRSWATLTSSDSLTRSAMPGPLEPLHSQFCFLTLCYTLFGHSCHSQPLVDVGRTVHIVMEHCDGDLDQLLDERTKLQDQRVFLLAAHCGASNWSSVSGKRNGELLCFHFPGLGPHARHGSKAVGM